MCLGEVDLAQVLAHLGRDIVELELGVDFFFGFSGNRFLAFKSGETVLVQRVAHLQRALAKRDVVGLRSGEVLHGGAEGFGWKQSHVYLHAVAQMKTDLVISARDDIHQRRIFRDVIDGFLASGLGATGFACDQDIEIAHSFTSTAKGTSGSDLVDARELRDVGNEFLCFFLGGVDQEPAADPLVIGDGLQQFRFVFLSHPGQSADLAFARKFLNAINVRNFVGAPDEGNRLGTEALNFQQLKHRGVISLEQLCLSCDLARAQQLFQLVEHSLADSRNGEHLLGIADDVFDLLGVILNRLGSVAVGAYAERILAVDLEQVGGFKQNVGNSLVVHVLKDKPKRGWRSESAGSQGMANTTSSP